MPPIQQSVLTPSANLPVNPHKRGFGNTPLSTQARVSNPNSFSPTANAAVMPQNATVGVPAPSVGQTTGNASNRYTSDSGAPPNPASVQTPVKKSVPGQPGRPSNRKQSSFCERREQQSSHSLSLSMVKTAKVVSPYRAKEAEFIGYDGLNRHNSNNNKHLRQFSDQKVNSATANYSENRISLYGKKSQNDGFMAKEAIIIDPIVAGIGALNAPRGKRWEGASRGLGRLQGVRNGATLGATTGLGIGGGIGGLIGFLANKNIMPDDLARHAGLLGNEYRSALPTLGGVGLGALAGSGLGALIGAVKGYGGAGDYMGPPSYDPYDPYGEKKRQKSSSVGDVILPAIDQAVGGSGLEAARGYSRGEKGKKIRDRALSGAGKGLLSGLGGLVGMGAGGAVGGLGGGTLGYLLSRLSSDPVAKGALPLSLGLIGGGVGAGVGGYHLSRLPYG